MKKSVRLFLRSWYLSSVILFGMIFGIYAAAKAYENIRFIGFGEYRPAIELENGVLRIFDFEISF